MTDAGVAPKSFLLTPELATYLVGHGNPPDADQVALIEETRALGPIAGMQIAPEQGAFLTLLTRLVGASYAVEVGTFTGYSALCIARGLPADGRLLCCDVSEEWTAIARRAWARAGVAERIELRLAPGADTLRSLPKEETIDLAFVDADKPGYPVYYEEILSRLRPNGVLLVDNVLWDGRVVQPDADDDNTKAIRAFNDMVAADDRVEAVMLPIADGLTLCRKK
ncbi:MAG TPA: class I SAM-dependent methyltransferase [Acidimicrobiia bacterium]|nr:class I SAM-dependent methyltransferase [Acidimicrobiia bacterium]